MHTVDSIQSGSTVDGHGTLCGGQMSCVIVPHDVPHSPRHSITFHIQPHTHTQNVSHSSVVVQYAMCMIHIGTSLTHQMATAYQVG